MADFELSDEDLAGFDKITSKPSEELVLSEEDLAGFDKAAPGMLESAGRGIVEGSTFGLGDELAGLQKAATGEDMGLTTFLPGVAMAKATKNLGGKLYDVATTDKTVSDLLKELKDTYTSKRDEVRTDNKLAQETNPWSYGLGDVGASIATGVATGGAGLVGKGLSAAGLKLAAKEGGKELLEQGVKRGGLGALTTIGAVEGALHGAGRSEADLTKGEVGEFATDTGIGGLIGGGIPLALKGAGYVADKVVSKTPLLGDVYEHLKNVGREGAKRQGQSFKQAGQESLEDLAKTGKILKDTALGQEVKYGDDVLKAKEATNRALRSSTLNWQETLQKAKNIVGNDIDQVDEAIEKGLNSYGTLNDYITQVNDKIKTSKFNFSDFKSKVDETSRLITKNKALDDVFERLQAGGYKNYAEQMKTLNQIIQASDPEERIRLRELKSMFQKRVDDTLQGLPDGELKNLYQKRMDLNKDYSLVASLQEDIGAGYSDSVSKLQTKASLAANPTGGGADALEYESLLDIGKNKINQNMSTSTDDLLAKGKEYNKFNVDNPELGTMFDPSTSQGQTERQIQQFKEVFGKPKEFGSPSSLSTTLQQVGDLKQNLTGDAKQENLIQWIRSSFGDEAEPLIKELQEKSKSFRTLEDAREVNRSAGQDVSSWIRGIKKTIDQGSYIGGQMGGKIPSGTQANTMRALTQPRLYKNIVNDFKKSQQQGDVDPNDVE